MDTSEYVRLSAIVQSSEDAIVSKMLDGTITSWNPAAEHIFGFTANEAIGKNITIIIPADRMDEERQIISKVKEGERIEHYETIRKKKNGDTVSIALTISSIKDAEGNIIGVSKIARDISAQRIAEEKQATLAILEAPVTLPFLSFTGDTVREILISRPSLVLLTVSKWLTCLPLRICEMICASSLIRATGIINEMCFPNASCSL